MNQLRRIVINPEVHFAQPTVAGTPLVYAVLEPRGRLWFSTQLFMTTIQPSRLTTFRPVSAMLSI